MTVKIIDAILCYYGQLYGFKSDAASAKNREAYGILILLQLLHGGTRPVLSRLDKTNRIYLKDLKECN